MSTIEEKQAALRAEQERLRRDQERICHVAAEIFDTDNGRELLSHLCKRFDILGRSFLVTDRGEVNALRAGVRDGERAAVNYLIQMIRLANKDYQLPL